MKFRLSLPKFSSSRKARSKALTLSVVVGVLTFVMATLGSRLVAGKVSSVVVAASDLQPGQILTDKDLKDAGKMTGVLPQGVYTSKNQVVGLSLSFPVKAGQPLVAGLVSKTPQRNGLYPGEVGVWVGVTLTSSGLVEPGDLVDVYLASSASTWGKIEQPKGMNSLQGVRVVAVVNGSAQPVKTDASNPNGNVPAAVELAIPKINAGDFSQIAAGKVSLMLDPFATPRSASEPQPAAQGSTGSTASMPPVPSAPAPGIAAPTPAPAASVMPPAPATAPAAQSQPSNVTGNTAPVTGSPVPNSAGVDSGAFYTPPIYNPNDTNAQNK